MTCVQASDKSFGLKSSLVAMTHTLRSSWHTGTSVVETSNTQLGVVMGDLEVANLPLKSRDTFELLQLQPGVQSTLGADLFFGGDQPGVVSVNGGRARSNNYNVNGGTFRGPIHKRPFHPALSGFNQ